MIHVSFRASDHTYWADDGRELPSVSSVLQQAQDEQVLAGVPEARSYVTIWPARTSWLPNPALSKGQAVHQWLDAHLLGRAGEPEHKECREFMEWEKRAEPVWGEHERIVWSVMDWYAGTLDRTMDLLGERWLLDFKTGRKIYGSAYLQLGAYWRAAKCIGVAAGMGGIMHLGPEGISLVPIPPGQMDYLADLFVKLKQRIAFVQWERQEGKKML